MTAGIPDEAKEKFARRRVPMRRYGDPEEVAQLTVGLVLPASSYLTGAVIPVDGGLLVQNTCWASPGGRGRLRRLSSVSVRRRSLRSPLVSSRGGCCGGSGGRLRRRGRGAGFGGVRR